MQLEIKTPLNLLVTRPELPNWLFNSDNKIIPQIINLDEIHMKELIMFLERYTIGFDLSRIKVNIVTFSDIILEYV